MLLFENSDAAYGRPELNINTLIIRMLGVAPEARGHGIAYALLNDVLRYAKERGDKAIHLHTTDKMSDAIKLYERYGYKRDYEKEFWRLNFLVKCYRYDIIE